LGFFTWYPSERVYVQGKDEDSATLAAIRSVYHELGKSRPHAERNAGEEERVADRPLYYLL
jgi:hypothetical protein